MPGGGTTYNHVWLAQSQYRKEHPDRECIRRRVSEGGRIGVDDDPPRVRGSNSSVEYLAGAGDRGHWPRRRVSVGPHGKHPTSRRGGA
jgi:hypothetical protein